MYACRDSGVHPPLRPYYLSYRIEYTPFPVLYAAPLRYFESPENANAPLIVFRILNNDTNESKCKRAAYSLVVLAPLIIRGGSTRTEGTT